MIRPMTVSCVARSVAVGLLLSVAACGDDDESAASDVSETSVDASADGVKTDEDDDQAGHGAGDQVIGEPPAGQIVANIGGNSPVAAEIHSCTLGEEGDIMIHSDPDEFPNIDLNIKRTDSGDLDFVVATVELGDPADVFILGTEDATLVVDGRYVNVATNAFSQPAKEASFAGLIRATCE